MAVTGSEEVGLTSSQQRAQNDLLRFMASTEARTAGRSGRKSRPDLGVELRSSRWKEIFFFKSAPAVLNR